MRVPPDYADHADISPPAYDEPDDFGLYDDASQDHVADLITIGIIVALFALAAVIVWVVTA